MEKSQVLKKILENLTADKTKDYTYLSIFFVVFSIFAFFAIRPSLVTAFSLKKEEEDLRKVDALYEKVIGNVVTNQSILEQLRDKLPLLDDALPEGPNINEVLNDIQGAASENSLILTNISIQEVELVESKHQATRFFAIQAETTSDFSKITDFVKLLRSQRRLKNIKMINIAVEAGPQATQSGGLKIKMEVAGYYL